MANRRMITRDIVRSDGFITLPFSFQVLYLHLTIEADDAGFVGSSKSVLRLSGCSDGDIVELEKSGYIYRFESGVVLLRHWKAANTVQADRRKSTTFQRELDLVMLDSNKTYVMLDPDCIQNGSGLDVQDNVTQRNLTEFKKGNSTETRTTEGKGRGRGTNSVSELPSDTEYGELSERFGGCVEVDRWLSMSGSVEKAHWRTLFASERVQQSGQLFQLRRQARFSEKRI